MKDNLHLSTIKEKIWGSSHRSGQPSSSPQILGLYNFRDIGGYEVCDTKAVRRGYVFRSASLRNVSQAGLQALRDHFGIKAIFELRSDEDSKTTIAIEGITTQHITTINWEESQEILLKHFNRLSDDVVESFMVIYEHYCTVSAPAYRKIFAHIRDRFDSPLLVYDNLGKDQTGVFIAIVLNLLGVSDEDIIGEYHRSEAEIEGLIPEKRARLHGLSIFDGRPPEKLEKHFLAPREVMRAFLVYLGLTYGGGEGYLTFLGFADAEIELIKNNLIESKSVRDIPYT
jgi:protein tyrosine/serine phosphatase